MPLPFEFKYLLTNNENSYLALDTALLGSLYTRYKNFDWRPSLALLGGRRISNQLAINGKLFIDAEIKRSREERIARTIGTKAGFLLQLNKNFAINPSISIINEKGKTVAKYLGEIPASIRGTNFIADRWRFPLSIDVLYAFSRQWELSINANYYRINFDSGFSSVVTYLTAIHYF